MTYYAEDSMGNRRPIKEWQYLRLTHLFGWFHVIRDEAVTIITKDWKGN